MDSHPLPQSTTKGAAYLTLAWLSATSMAIFACLVHPMASIWTILLFQSSLGLILITPWMSKQKFAFHSWGLLALRTACGFLGGVCIFSALACTTIINTTLLNNTAPLFLPLVLFLWLRYKVAPKMWLGILIGFLGVALILKPHGSFAEEEGLLFGLGSGILWAIAQVTLRLLTKKEGTYSILFYYFLLCTLLSMPFAWMTYKPINSTCFVWLLLTALSSFLSQIFYIKAFSYARPIKINPFNYSGVVFSYIAGWLIWHKEPDLMGYVGIVLIMIGTGYTLYLDRKSV